LVVHFLCCVAGQGRDYGNLIIGEEVIEILEAWLFEDGQIATVGNRYSASTCVLDEVSKAGMHFGRAACQVERLYDALAQDLEEQLHCFVAHPLSAVWPCVDVAMLATLIAEVAKIDLKRCKRMSRQ
jgi:hypothetical protein